MLPILSAVCGAAIVGLAVVTWLYTKVARDLGHFKDISDIEGYAAECESKAEEATKSASKADQQRIAILEEIKRHQVTAGKYQKYLGNLKTAAELKESVAVNQKKAQQLAGLIGGLRRASELKNVVDNQQEAIARQKSEIAEFAEAIGEAKTASEIAAKVRYYENYLDQLKADVESVEEAGRLQEFGFYAPRFEFDTSDEYKRRLDTVRAQQKRMLKDKTACICNVEWNVDGNRREGKKMVNQQIKLMLRAFNGECDAAVSKAKYNNVVSLDKRIHKSFVAINKLGESKQAYLTGEYCQLKIDELHLAHEFQEKKQEEKEEQRRIRERMREDEKVEKEIEKAQKEAEKEEDLKTRALEKARAELAQKEGMQTEKLAALVSKLENELQEALDRKAKAIARAQLTRSGHVYVLSNVGTFGEGVYKIGLTRRLEPLERVKELGGASVPFPFDVHAMIYSEDAPALEATLHRHFSNRRVNRVNLRREFFRVTLDEIRAAVAKHFGYVTFVTEPEAEQFRKTQAMRREAECEKSPLQIA
jgi:hypothetical protein